MSDSYFWENGLLMAEVRKEWPVWPSFYERQQQLNWPLVTTKVCRRASLNAQYVEPWNIWATAAGDHTWCHSYHLKQVLSPNLIQMGSEFGGNNICMYGSILTCINGSGFFLLSIVMEDATQLGPLGTNGALCTYLSILADYVHPFLATGYRAAKGYFQHGNMLFFLQIKSSQTVFPNITMILLYSDGLYSYQI